ncbi:hypothetical protein [Pseudomonas aeruginosa]|uniref:hypothetical protein n=1 Tax=Pseudomonas aeruginosa TaxID=287 RepID=UPI000B0D3712|nr:hypothetical protein [Pseudomonas aeruginosa]MCC4276148.1 hypothetical protein [Pseudomonas aeruginosa]HBO2703604.1 hypothetical protein [Pseudomonas aeruginosa]HEP9714169.1 hypothetical protein [Pseudomonas aeruginosa]
MKYLYLGHPPHCYDDDLGHIAERFAQEVSEDTGWAVRSCPYEGFNQSLNVQQFSSLVLQNPGPILLLRPVQARTVELIRNKLGGRLPIEVREIETSETLRDAVIAAEQRFDAGEPFLSLDLIVGLLLIRKLDKERMWGGNAKGYMWVEDIPNGRGLDEKYAGRVPHVLNVLLQQELLISKKSGSSKKYALNPDMREAIYDALRSRILPGKAQGYLTRGDTEESIRALDLLDEYLEEGEG